MARPFKLTEHALLRFAERHPEFDALEPDESRQVLHAELEHGVPFGAQFGDEELYLLPCGFVAVVAWRDGVGVVKTVLRREHAMANMQAQLGVLRVSRFGGGAAARAGAARH